MACARSSSPCTHDGIDFYTFHAFLQCTLHEACAYDSVTVRVNKKNVSNCFFFFKKILETCHLFIAARRCKYIAGLPGTALVFHRMVA